MIRAAIDDMLGRFERTSEAYLEGERHGHREALKAASGDLEKMVWNREGDQSKGADVDVLMEALRTVRALQR